MRSTLFLVGALLVAACSSSSPSTGDAGSTADADASPGSDAGDASAVGDTWTSFGQGFFAKYCVECHAVGNANRDYTTLTDVVRDKDLIRCGVASTTQASCPAFPPARQFPIDNASKTNPKPTDAERDRVVAWIAAGLPQ